MGLSFHHETHEATCTSPAYCDLCKSNFGGINSDNHDWGEWIYENENQHYRICGLNEVHIQYADHRGYATCIDSAPCLDCERPYKDPDNHQGGTICEYEKVSDTEHKVTVICESCHTSIDTYDEAHSEKTPATCTSGAVCEYCGENYGAPDPDAHDLESHAAQAPTCYKTGWDAYEACRREGCTYTTFAEKGTLVHWYGEWTPNADGTHSATCRYGCGYRRTVPCAPFTYQLNGDPVAEFTLCPVCGEVNDGTRLTMAEGARAAALTRTLPGGEVVVRVGVLSGGEAVMSVAFESAGCLTKPTGQVKVSLPAEWLEGYALRLLAADGTETELTFDVHKEEASFVLDFTDSPSAVRVIRLVPAA
ncbi:MAG: hypothetical protein ACI4MG_03815 [Aristaeellaceae bacterium]